MGAEQKYAGKVCRCKAGDFLLRNDFIFIENGNSKVRKENGFSIVRKGAPLFCIFSGIDQFIVSNANTCLFSIELIYFIYEHVKGSS